LHEMLPRKGIATSCTIPAPRPALGGCTRCFPVRGLRLDRDCGGLDERHAPRCTRCFPVRGLRPQTAIAIPTTNRRLHEMLPRKGIATWPPRTGPPASP